MFEILSRNPQWFSISLKNFKCAQSELSSEGRLTDLYLPIDMFICEGSTFLRIDHSMADSGKVKMQTSA